jgi:hypothetical protein
MKTSKKVAIALLVLVVVGGFFGWRIIRRGFSARDTPTRLEVFVATAARSLAVPASYRSLKNPVPNSPENIRAGMEHFAYTIYNGIRLSGMPAFGEKDQSDADSTWQLGRFIRRLPSLSEEEEKQMEKLNPKSPMELSEESQEEQFLKGGKPPCP